MLCTGIAIVGLCFPLPGHLRADVEAAGWLIGRDYSEVGFSQSMSSGGYNVIVYLTAGPKLLETVSVSETGPGKRHFRDYVAKACQVNLGDNAPHKCRIGNSLKYVFDCNSAVTVLDVRRTDILKESMVMCPKQNLTK